MSFRMIAALLVMTLGAMSGCGSDPAPRATGSATASAEDGGCKTLRRLNGGSLALRPDDVMSGDKLFSALFRDDNLPVAGRLRRACELAEERAGARANAVSDGEEDLRVSRTVTVTANVAWIGGECALNHIRIKGCPTAWRHDAPRFAILDRAPLASFWREGPRKEPSR